ncbi:hypothetical protein [uncultured Chitinophaga sp.]|uniref:hypothetical protein n=1 Tax=uncultured Chitinophaga sp. TaxID=339340 RepID=UPI0025D49970|nr:hypothetical protein [uncultured Chitinophaga sp.]
MKWFFVLFSLYVLTLSAVPCGGDDDCCTDGLELVDNHAAEHEQERPELPCSPFFSCNTFHVVLTPDYEYLPAPKQIARFDAGSFYITRFLAGYNPPIWQPPRPLLFVA